ncbi:MAG: 4-hydroxy-3-methylbut-2-enyl diphosphate reductase [Candidatus Omnitrophica bacterium]|nr:4-hydroxy-3-methylbut-2-enyl diphosphate reductase [Candidatus Omnitrophota bacterium]
MKINVAKSSGFCFGVRRAINMSLALAGNRKNLYVLGDIVHNKFVVEDLENRGIKKIKRITPRENAILIISAHGAGREAFEKAVASGFEIADATCPRVKDIYAIAGKIEKDRQVIIIGDKGHTEVKGIEGQLTKKPIIIESPDKIPYPRLKNINKAGVVTQSTQSISNINGIVEKLRKIIPDVELFKTTCAITAIKQKEIETLPKQNDAVLIVGGAKSANTKRLYQISKKINPNTFWIESAEGLKKIWFKKVNSVGIMAGASTPDEIVNKIVLALKNL